MPVGERAAALRTALERALNDPVHLLRTDDGIRISAPAPPPADEERWRRVFDTLRTADRYGSGYTPLGPEVWAEVNDAAGQP
jgi:hypothetical protein